MKLLAFFDPHVDVRGPINRTDEFEETCFNKLEEVGAIAYKRGCSYILCSGDFFNRKGALVPHRLIARSADCLKSFKVPFLTISGNHDQFGGDPETIMSQPLGVLSRAAGFKILGKTSVEQLDEDVFLTALPYYSGIDTHLEDYLPNRPEKAKIHIHLTHGSLMPKKPVWEPYTLYSQLVGCKADFVLNGHLHDGYPTEKVGNVTIVNPGSLTRGALTESNINRQVGVVLIDTDTKGVEFIPLKSALPASKCFNLEGNTETKLAEEAITMLGALIRHESGNVELSGPESIRHLVKELKTIKEPVRTKIFTLLDKAEESI